MSALLWVLNRRHRHGLLRRYGIPGPRPDLLDGNYAQLKENRIEVMERWIKEYGKVFGYYVGDIPYIVLTDVEMIKQCFVKEASTFHDRPPFPVVVEPFLSSIVGLEGDEWKKVRTVLNPSFSASKMKLMTQIMSSCADATLEVVEDHVKKGEVDCQKNPNDPLLLSVQTVFHDVENSSFQQVIRFPILSKIISRLFSFTSFGKMTTRVCDNIRHVIELRRTRQSARTTDMLQMLLDAQAGVEDSTKVTGQVKKLVEDRHLIANCFVFLIAGFETTASSLAFTIHLLAKYPEEQDRILDELNEVFPEENQELTYDGIQQLKRLDMVLCESLRMYPPVILFVSRGRECASERSSLCSKLRWHCAN
ncbi:cytochrome P450, putative [Ixodes scapularis]|uniref:Cytochrome P450, putative n=1 Tax=Ixodes scapularis TaxID=6945 RepID=B7PES7_IXOSC|nr:cytochrome P450, putative [Ixodes scapularis]|eukprot:XP_002433699.1 cytochrome P450, putative [Ixodes scapularis]